jgi:hypothetical protein
MAQLEAAKDQKDREKALQELEAAVKSLREAIAPQKPGAAKKGQKGPKERSNRNDEEANRWLRENGDKVVLSVDGPESVLFSTDPRFIAVRASQSAFLITQQEAAGVVQVLVETGLWGRPDGPQPCLRPPERTLGLHAQDAGGGRWWKLGEVDDDVSSLLIIRHLLNTFDGPRKEALSKWLRQGVGKKKR